MNRTTGIRLALLPAAMLACLPSAARADESLQVRLGQGVATTVAPGLTLSFDLSERLAEGPDQQVARVGLDQRLGSRVRIGGGVSYVWSEGRQEWRPNQDVTLSLGRFSLRTRLEERMIKDDPRTLVRWRNRVQYTLPATSSTRLQIFGETSHHLRGPASGQGGDLESWRAGTSIVQQLTDNFDASLSYTYIRSVRPGEDRITHAPGLSIGYDF